MEPEALPVTLTHPHRSTGSISFPPLSRAPAPNLSQANVYRASELGHTLLFVGAGQETSRPGWHLGLSLVLRATVA